LGGATGINDYRKRIFLAQKPEPQTNLLAPKKVNVYKLGSAPQITYQGKVEKTGVVKIVAQMPGIVSAINVSEGQQIGSGTNILSLSTNYQGGNAVSLQRQIAQTQYQNVKNTYDQQGDIIGRQKDLANKNHDNQVLLQQIAEQSIIDTQGLVNLDKTILDTLIAKVQASPGDPTNVITQEQISQFDSALIQTNSSLQNLKLQGTSNQSAVDSAQQQHDIAVEQLDVQRKALDLSLDISKLQYNLALVSEANMFPSTPIAGTVDRIFVKLGDSITPGTVLANISGSSQHVKVIVSVPNNIAKILSPIEPSRLQIDNTSIEMAPSYVSLDATDGNLYSVIYDLDDSQSFKLTDASYITVNIPIGTGNTTNENPFIPLDAIVQTQEAAFVYVVGKNNIAQVIPISLGQIQGKFVEVTNGLPKEAQIILNRNVIQGDKVQVIR
jgi:multidrug efflux pump subunit AcrA (membrane-fusion protein)